MFLKSIHIQHYKSLANVEMDDLKPLTLLTGRNAAGKSNVIDVLKFLRDIAANGLDHAMSDRGGIGIVRQYAVSKPYKINPGRCQVDELTRKRYIRKKSRRSWIWSR